MLKQECPEVKDAVRFKGMGKVIVRFEERQFYEKYMYYVEQQVFDVFTFPLIEGDPKTVLVKPYSVVITQEMAEKYFGSERPIGKVLTLDNKNDFIVTGVMKNLPKTTHREINMLCSFATLYALNQPDLHDWMNYNYYTYVLLKKGADFKSLEEKFPDLIKRYIGDDTKKINGTLSFYLLPLKKLYLYSNLDGNSPGLITEIFYYILLAVFLTLIACINFINLSTARASMRAKEIGVRKVLGAGKTKLIKQFLSESLVVSIISLLFAFMAVQLFLPVFSDKTGTNLTLGFGQSAEIYLGFLLLAVVIGLISGIYPAFYLAKFKPIETLKGDILFKHKKPVLRSNLVVLQFFISIVLICQTMFLNYQLDYLKNKDIGFHKKDVVVVPVTDDNVRHSMQTFKKELLGNINVLNITSISSLPGLGVPRNVKIPEGYSKNEMQLMEDIDVDSDFITALEIKLVAGRNFMHANKMDQQNAIIINQLAAKKFGWKNPLGKTIEYSIGQNKYAESTVIGVVKDFHLSSMHRVIEPLFISNNPNSINHILVRVSPQNINSTVEFIKLKWNMLFPDHPFQYSFLETHYDKYFRTLEKVFDVLAFFSILAIQLACLGIFALAAFISTQRTKEIGIRKVLGCSTFRIVVQLNFELLKYVFIAILFLIPYIYFTKDYLKMFLPYMAVVNYSIYVEVVALVIVVAIISVSYQSIKAAIANPVNSLKYE
jgi:putative ABC transport system permease protein